MPRANLRGEVFGKFSVKLTHADAVGVGMCGILRLALPVASPRERFGGKKNACGFMLWGD